MSTPDHHDLPRRVVGVDPGPIPGFVVLDLHSLDRPEFLQCSASLAPGVLRLLLASYGATVVQIEQFVVGRRSTRSSTAAAGKVTRAMVYDLQHVAEDYAHVHLRLRIAAEVKPWATDQRLDAAGLLTATKGMRHARDAARHALYAAVQTTDLPDPLTGRWSV